MPRGNGRVGFIFGLVFVTSGWSLSCGSSKRHADPGPIGGTGAGTGGAGLAGEAVGGDEGFSGGRKS